jgi:PAS domain-containing protein
MPFSFWVKDEEGRYLWVNRALADMATEDIVGKKDSELPWVNNAEALRADDLRLLDTGKPVFLHEYVAEPHEANLSVCKFVADFEGKRCAFGVSFIIE